MHNNNSENYALTQKITQDTPLFFLAACPLNCEDLLAKEITALGGQNIEKIPAGIYFSGTIELLYRTCLWARTASSVKLIIKRFTAENKEALYQQVVNYPWFDHFSAENTFACQSTASRKTFAPTNFLTLLLKDGIADSFRKIFAERPNVNTERAHMIAALHMEGSKGILSLELGRSLHERIRRVNPDASLHGSVLKRRTPAIQENLAAALLYRMQWLQNGQNGRSLFIPYCTDGIFLSEAAAMASDYPPQLHKTFIGFEHWRQFDKTLWQQIKDQASQKFEQGLKNCPPVYGYVDERKINTVRKTLEKSPLAEKICLRSGDFFQTEAPDQKAVMLLNPPLGDIFKDPAKVRALYQDIGIRLKEHFAGWDIAAILPTEELLRELDVRTDRLNTFYHGAEKCCFARFSLFDKPKETPPLTQQARKLKTELQKQYEKICSLAENTWKTNVYRLYNNTLEAYPAVCDIYDDVLIVQSFASAPEIKELTRVCREVTGITRPNTLIKKRRKISSDDQYTAEMQTLPLEKIIFEGAYRYYVNLSSYIDTGFYLDHRPLRRILEKEVRGKSFLNLFCYTAAMSIVAAAAGAVHVCSVDTSNTYLNTAKKNALLNKIETKSMQWVRADVRNFLAENKQKWDIIYVDPPTYSNGTGRGTFDIQRDHADLIHSCTALLAKNGLIYFSTHFKRFSLDPSLEKLYRIKNITEKSVDEDCAGRQIPHYLWQIRLKG